MVLAKTLENPLDCKEIQPVSPKGNQSWIFIGRTDTEAPNTLATWCKEPAHWKRPWCWERLRAGRKGVNRGWDGWMASSTQWTWVWVSSRSWWQTGRPGVLRSTGSQRVRHNWVTRHACLVRIFNLRNCQSIFQSSCTVLYSYQLCGRILISVHHHQHLILSVFPLGAVTVSA